MRSLAVCVAALVPAMLPGQQTLVVDPAGGGGAFTTVQAALAAAAPGDTLFVRGGTYPGAHVVPGPLQIVGDPTLPRPFLSSVQILPGSGGGVSLVYLRAGAATVQGGAALDGVSVGDFLVQAGSVVMSRCDNFALNSRVTGGDVVFHDCTLLGYPATYQQTLGTCTPFPAKPALTVTGGTVAFANCTVTGGWGGTVCFFFPMPGVPSTALVVNGGQVRATRSQFVGGGRSSGGSPSTPAVTVASGAFAYDASTTFVGVGTTPGAVIFLPATDGQSALGGGTITATLQTVPGLAALLAASLGRGTSLPTFAGDVWFDPANHVVLAFGVTDPSGRLGASVPVPLAVQRGTAVTAQGGAIAPAGVAVAATPVIVHVQ
jgi:hypothetical protein